jgi:hypothetical protein
MQQDANSQIKIPQYECTNQYVHMLSRQFISNFVRSINDTINFEALLDSEQ